MVARDFLISCLVLLLIVDAGVSVRFGVAVLVNALCLVPEAIMPDTVAALRSARLESYHPDHLSRKSHPSLGAS